MAYVYLHRRTDKDIIFYVGIGTNDDDGFKRSRARKDRNRLWHNVVRKTPYTVEIAYENITAEDAIEIEIYLISLIGRKDLGLGELVNMTAGGQGTAQLSEETRKKLRNSKLGKVGANAGKTFSDDIKNKMSAAHMGQKHSAEAKAKMKKTRTGRKFTKEHCEAISKGKMGKPIDEVRRQKLIAANTGLRKTPEQKANIKAKMLKYWEKRKKKEAKIKKNFKYSKEHRAALSASMKRHFAEKKLKLNNDSNNN